MTVYSRTPKLIILCFEAWYGCYRNAKSLRRPHLPPSSKKGVFREATASTKFSLVLNKTLYAHMFIIYTVKINAFF